MTANPLMAGLSAQRAPGPCSLVLFGATGDLAKRKLIPALVALSREHLLPHPFALVGFGRQELHAGQWRDAMRAAADEFGDQPAGGAWEPVAAAIDYVQGDLDHPADFQRLGAALEAVEQARQIPAGRRIFYCAIPPSAFTDAISNLQGSGLHRAAEQGFPRMVIEKPFGRSLETARALNAQLLAAFPESQIFRIDHYLGKETVQNLLALRFANTIFEPVWNRRYVDSVQISAAETVGVERRASYYEESGALRDMIQNHTLQLLSLTAMEPPVAFEADAVRDETVKVLRSIHRPSAEEVEQAAVRGQYGPGSLLGKDVPGYRDEPGVRPDSATETFAALRLAVQNWRWDGVPFYIRTGKRLPKRVSEIAIQFRALPHRLFPTEALEQPNQLVIRIQPDEGVALRFATKVPGEGMRLRPVEMDFRYGQAFGRTPEAYERLLLDCMLGDATLFSRADFVENAWQIVQPVLDAWGARRPRFPNYAAGSWGPKEADELLAREGRAWRRL